MFSEMNYIKLLFGQMTVTIIFLSVIFNCFEKHLPTYLIGLFSYGKFGSKKNVSHILKSIEVPKAWFKHFYIFSSIISSIVLYLLINIYVFKKPVSVWGNYLLNTFGGKHGHAKVSPAATLLVLILFTTHNFRRLYETYFISVFGKSSRMNIIHYSVGFIHYSGAVLAILGEAPLVSTASAYNNILKSKDISYLELAGTVFFLWAWWHQHKATKILGNLSRKSKDKGVSQKHLIPEGDLFTYISCPHILTEILIYLSLSIIMWKNTTWQYITIWVVANQVETALLSHWWYKATFPNYPKERKLLIPFVF